MITTSDNPYNPWIDFDKWLEWDVLSGYNTLQYVSRIYELLNPDFAEGFNDEVWSQAEQEVLEVNITGNFIYIPEPTDVEELQEA